MDAKDKLKTLLKQAEIYQGQGLLHEAKSIYLQAGQIYKKNENAFKGKNVLGTIKQKIRALNDEINRIENAPPSPEMPEEVQNIIKSKFAFAKDEETSELEGAIALAKFGQFSRALREFQELIKKESIRLDAAKNIFRCHMALDSLEDAVAQYEEWFNSDLFKPDQLNKLRIFLQDILNKKGIDKTLPQAEVTEEAPAAESPAPEVAKGKPSSEEFEDEEILDISSIGITLEDGPRKGQTLEFDVNFQSGNVISLLISSKDKELIDNLKAGVMLNDVQFYSPIAMFNGKGIVASKQVIESGPKKGHYSLDIKVKSM